MMQHIRDHDWETDQTFEDFFDEATVGNSFIERLVRRTYHDPALSSEDENQESKDFDCDAVFKRDTNKTRKLFTPGLRPAPEYPKLSALTKIQHYQLLKVICANHPHILKQRLINKPSDDDYNAYEILKPIYENEQREFIEWAKSLWTEDHYIRALFPKRATEAIYNAEFVMRQHRLKGFATRFNMNGDVKLECIATYHYDIELITTLFGVNKSELPLIKLPRILEKTFVNKERLHPKPCHKHPYQFELPHKNCVSVLPITELHQELAQYAAENDTKFIASENALRCLMELHRYWTIPISVCQIFRPDGKMYKVVVLDSEFPLRKELAMTRTRKALKHMLETTFIPTAEVIKMVERRKKNHKESESKKQLTDTSMALALEELHLSIDESPPDHIIVKDKNGKVSGNIDTETNKHINEQDDVCECTYTRYELPSIRSFKKWRVKNTSTAENFDVIVHCAHKARNKSKEVLLEPIPEYQLELGGSELSSDRIRTLVLSLMLRESVDLVNVRLDGRNGEIVTIDLVSKDQFIGAHIEKRHQVLNIIHSTLSSIECLNPGHYLLQHATNGGVDAIMNRARPTGQSIKLDFSILQPVEPNEILITKIPPTIAPVLMPHHKFRKILPCAFTPYEGKKPPRLPIPQPKTAKIRKGKGKKNKNKKHVNNPQQHV